MDSFEAVIAAILERQGYWTRTSVKVELTREEKREIGRPSSPRWEIDVVAYSGRSNELLVVECKSYLDSPGVRFDTFDAESTAERSRYKLFHEETLRRVVLNRLKTQLVQAGFCAPDPSVQLCLAAGKVNGDAEHLRGVCEQRGWTFWGPEWVRDELLKLADSGYDNTIASVVTKLLIRNSPRGSTARDTLPRQSVDNETHRSALVAAFYLSKFEHDRLGLGNQDETFSHIAEALGVKKATLRNYRDYFDPHTGSHRRGWWQAANLPPQFNEIEQELRSVSEEELRELVLAAVR